MLKLRNALLCFIISLRHKLPAALTYFKTSLSFSVSKRERVMSHWSPALPQALIFAPSLCTFLYKCNTIPKMSDSEWFVLVVCSQWTLWAVDVLTLEHEALCTRFCFCFLYTCLYVFQFFFFFFLFWMCRGQKGGLTAETSNPLKKKKKFNQAPVYV